MSGKENLIYTVYKEFYGKEPNLSEENQQKLTIEIQTMVFILDICYGITIGDYRFAYNELIDLMMPVSMKLQDDIVGKLLNKNLEDLDLIPLLDNCQKVINIVGLKITEEIKDKKDPIEALRLISSILYNGEYIMPSSSLSEVSEYNNCSKEEVESIRKLVKDIVYAEAI